MVDDEERGGGGATILPSIEREPGPCRSIVPCISVSTFANLGDISFEKFSILCSKTRSIESDSSPSPSLPSRYFVEKALIGENMFVITIFQGQLGLPEGFDDLIRFFQSAENLS